MLVQIAICPKFLRGLCDDSECLLSHVVSADKMPVCRHFLTGLCNNDDCPYLHVKVEFACSQSSVMLPVQPADVVCTAWMTQFQVSDKASVCKDFLKGFCPRGTQCCNKHVLVCQALCPPFTLTMLTSCCAGVSTRSVFQRLFLRSSSPNKDQIEIQGRQQAKASK